MVLGPLGIQRRKVPGKRRAFGTLRRTRPVAGGVRFLKRISITRVDALGSPLIDDFGIDAARPHLRKRNHVVNPRVPVHVGNVGLQCILIGGAPVDGPDLPTKEQDTVVCEELKRYVLFNGCRLSITHPDEHHAA